MEAQSGKMTKSNGAGSGDVRSEGVLCISMLMEEVLRYFPDFHRDTPKIAVTRNPFKFPVQDVEEDVQNQSLDFMQDSFDEETLSKF